MDSYSKTMLWGGLRPIVSRLVLDVLTLLGLTCAVVTSSSSSSSSYNKISLAVLTASCLLTLTTTAEWTNRWTITFPVIPLVVLQLLLRHRTGTGKGVLWINRLIFAGSLFLIVLATTLSILFTAVELPPVPGPYNVGVVDFHLRVNVTTTATNSNPEATACVKMMIHEDLPVRILYPTLDEPLPIPLLNPLTAREFLRQNMQMAAPGPLKPYDWMLHHWRLIQVHRTKRNASLLPAGRMQQRLPLIIFSHGLGGTAEIYSYQTMALAAQGSVVLQLNHQDGSAPVVLLSNGTTVEYDTEIINLWNQGKKLEYVQERRARTNLRTLELIAATEALHKMNQQDNLDFTKAGSGLSFRNRLAVDHTIFFGHSFGAATALTAAQRRPDLVHSIIAHDPAVDWMPDDSRHSLFPKDRLLTEGLKVNFTGDHMYSEVCLATSEECNENVDNDNDNDNTNSLHDLDMLVLYSKEWYKRKWAGSDVLHILHMNNLVGPTEGISEVGIVDCHHTEFSDVSMILPLWIARAVNITGTNQSPIATAHEIQERTKHFIEAIRQRSHF